MHGDDKVSRYAPHQIDGSSCAALSMALADVNGEGKVDVMIAQAHSKFCFFSNAASAMRNVIVISLCLIVAGNVHAADPPKLAAAAESPMFTEKEAIAARTPDSNGFLPGRWGQSSRQKAPMAQVENWSQEVLVEAPLIRYPTVVCSAPDGRIFVAEDIMDLKRIDADLELGRIVCLHPDGRISVFAEKLHAPFGMRYLNGYLYVLHNPHFSVFRDDDGIGRDRVDLVTTNPMPWPNNWNDHVPANFRLAMDGYLYISTGDKGFYSVGTDGRRFGLQGGGLLRMRPDGSDMQVYTSGTRNHLDVAINAEDDFFTYDNTDEDDWWSRLAHMIDGADYGYPWEFRPKSPHVLSPMTEFGPGAATASLAYTEDALPEEYHGDLFLSDWYKSQIMRVEIEKKGATYAVLGKTDLLSENRYRPYPVGIDVSADGMSLYVCDWGGHYEGPDFRGQLLKLTYTGKSHAMAKPDWYVPAALGKKVDVQIKALVVSLSHPSRRVRMTAQHQLIAKGVGASKDIVAMLKDPKSNSFARSHGIWTLSRLDRASCESAAVELLSAGDNSVAKQAMRCLGALKSKSAVPQLCELLQSSDAVLRFEAATALGRIGEADALLPLSRQLDEIDPVLAHSLTRAINRIGRKVKLHWPPVLESLSSDNQRVRENASIALRETYDPELVKALAAFSLDEKQSTAGRSIAVRLLGELYRSYKAWEGGWFDFPPAEIRGTHPYRSKKPPKTELWDASETVLDALVAGLGSAASSTRLACLRELKRLKLKESLPAVRKLFQNETEAENKSMALLALAAFDDPESVGFADKTLEDSGASDADVKLAIALASEMKRSSALITYLSDAPDNVETVRQALEALSGTHGNGKELFAKWVKVYQQYLVHRDTKISHLSALGLAKLGGGKAVESLQAALANDDNPDVQKHAIEALGYMGRHHDLVTAIDNPTFREHALRALTRVPKRESLSFYLKGMTSSSYDVSGSCREIVNVMAPYVRQDVETILSGKALDKETLAACRKLYDTRLFLTRWKVLTRQPDGGIPFVFSADGLLSEAVLQGKFNQTRQFKGNWEDFEAERGSNWCELSSRRYSAVGPDTNNLYAYTSFYSPADIESQFTVRSRAPFSVRVNGKEILNSKATIEDEATTFKASLRKGSNSFLLQTPSNLNAGFELGWDPVRAGKIFSGADDGLSEDDYIEFTRLNHGNPTAGRKIFFESKSTACASCHQVMDKGGKLGPNLSQVGKLYNREQLATHVLFPSLAVREGYQLVTVLLEGGQVYSGRIVEETDETLYLGDVALKRHRIAVDDIDMRINRTVSIMPQGLCSKLSLEQFSDLIAFLTGLK